MNVLRPRTVSRYRIALSCVIVALVPVLGGCTSSSAPSTQPTTTPAPTVSDSAGSPEGPRLKAGRRVAALDFAVAPANGPLPTTIAPKTATGQQASLTSEEAVSALITAISTQDWDTAWSLISDADQRRIGSQERFTQDSLALGWLKFDVTTDDVTTGDSVTVTVTQTPRVSDIDGVIPATTTVVVPTTAGPDGYTVDWSRRRLTPNFPLQSASTDERAAATAIRWATDRQACQPSTLEQNGGLIGVVGLADSLCNTTTPPVASEVTSLDLLDEPEPILAGFGSSAFQWARVVKLTEPIAMNVVMAPLGDEWITIGIARPSLADT